MYKKPAAVTLARIVVRVFPPNPGFPGAVDLVGAGDVWLHTTSGN